jgi:hypothetical protein
MRFVACGVCRNERIPLNASLLVDDVVHCESCLKEKFPTDADVNGKKIVKEFDPTVCFNCSTDSGDIILKRLGSYPVCDTCEQAIQARVFPTWVKAFFAGVIVLVMFSLAWNRRFIEAYYQMKEIEAVMESGSVMESGKLQEAADLYTRVSVNVPEIIEFDQLSSYCKGMLLLQDDKAAEALDAFQRCTALPDSYNLPILTLQAEIAVLYDNKDYPGFVAGSKRYLSFDSTSIALAQVASAYACVYASQRSDSARSMAMEYLAKANAVHDTTRFFSDYVNRIEYRLATGEIIDKEDFDAKFPNGWSK